MMESVNSPGKFREAESISEDNFNFYTYKLSQAVNGIALVSII